MIALFLFLAVQGAPQADPQPQLAPNPGADTTPSPRPDPERGTGGVIAYSDVSDAEARRVMARFAACVADTSDKKAGEVLTQDFRSTSYSNGLRNLARSNEGCARRVGLSGSMRMANLAFAGALSEALIAKKSQPANALLVRAAASSAAPTYSFTDRIAMCVVRSAPDQVSTLFATEPASDDEAAAITTLGTAAQLCAKAARATKPLSISPAGLRAMLATAAFRALSGPGNGA